MKTLKTLTITGLVRLTAVNACPMGGNDMHKSMKHQRGEMKKMFTALDLSAEQKEQMQALSQEMKAQHKERKSAMIKKNFAFILMLCYNRNNQLYFTIRNTYAYIPC